MTSGTHHLVEQEYVDCKRKGYDIDMYKRPEAKGLFGKLEDWIKKYRQAFIEIDADGDGQVRSAAQQQENVQCAHVAQVTLDEFMNYWDSQLCTEDAPVYGKTLETTLPAELNGLKATASWQTSRLNCCCPGQWLDHAPRHTEPVYGQRRQPYIKGRSFQ